MTEHLEPPSDFAGMDESAWVDVIHKMDEVYSRLVADEVALEEKNAQLEQSQQFIFGLLSAMSDVLVACNEEGRIEETNRALCELLGRSEQELRDVALASLLADEPSQQHWQQMVLGSGQQDGGCVMEVQLRNAEGASVSVDMNCTPRHNNHGQHIGYVLVGRPMGEIKRAYHQLREAHEALKRTQQQLLHSEKMASLGRLVAGVAHELNNPISFVLGNVYSLQRYSQRLQQYLQQVHQAELPEPVLQLRKALRIDRLLEDLPSLMDGTLEGAQRTADIVSALKRFSAMDREELGRVELNAVVERAIHWVRKGTAPRFHIEWTHGSDCFVNGHGGQLLQVMMNLIQNAYDATATRSEPVAELHIHLSQRDDRVYLCFDDNGPGIAPEHMQRIFEPFFTTKSVGVGTGLGLSISYGIVQQHQGVLSAQNLPQGGARFTLELPLSPIP